MLCFAVTCCMCMSVVCILDGGCYSLDLAADCNKEVIVS